MTRPAVTLAVGVLLLSLSGLRPPASLRAQDLSMRIGGLHARYADTVVGDAGSLGARLAWTTLRTRGLLEGSWAQFTTGDGAGQGWTDVTLVGPSSPRAAAGLHFSGIANGGSGTWSGYGTADVFGVVAVRRWTLSLSLAGGGVRDFSAASTPVASVTMRTRYRLDRRTSLTASAIATTAGTTRFADATLAADWRRGRFSAGGLVGTRTGDLSYRPWAQVFAGWAITPAMSLEGSAGGYPRDLTGFDHGTFVNVGLRLNLARGTSDDAADTEAYARTLPTAATRASSDVVAEALDSLTTRVTFRLPDATHVAISGDWNEWTDAPLEFAGGDRWTAIINAASGAHRFTLTVDGRSFIPPSVAKLTDDFGGEVGLLIVR